MPQTMRFEVGALREAVARNRDAHHEQHVKAMAGYREQAVRELESMLADARTGKRIRRSVQLIEPLDMTREYDRILKMLEMTTETEIGLTPTEFSQYVLDDWGWKEQVTATNSRYIL